MTSTFGKTERSISLYTPLMIRSALLPATFIASVCPIGDASGKCLLAKLSDITAAFCSNKTFSRTPFMNGKVKNSKKLLLAIIAFCGKVSSPTITSICKPLITLVERKLHTSSICGYDSFSISPTV